MLTTSVFVDVDAKPDGRRNLLGLCQITGHVLWKHTPTQAFKKGVGILAGELGVPVVPVSIVGTFHVLPVGAWWPRVRPIAVRFGEPVSLSSETMRSWREQGVDPYEAASALIRDAVLHLAESNTGP